MKLYVKEWIILILQLGMFYIFPLFAGPTDPMGMVVVLLLATLLLSIAAGIFSNSKLKFLYPIVAAVLFIPSVFIYYNTSALIHALWYLAVALNGVMVGSGINALVSNPKQKK